MKRIILASISLCLMGDSLAGAALRPAPGSRAAALHKVIEGADRLVVTDRFYSEGKAHSPPSSIEGKERIAELIENLSFNDLRSGFHCMCSGDALITFYKGTNELATLSHHHGTHLRWKGWDGDSLFTEETMIFWPDWFARHGEPRFKEAREADLARAREEKRLDDLFISVYPGGAAAVFNKAPGVSPRTMDPDHTPSIVQLAKLFPNRDAYALALAKSLGVLAAEGDDCGSWSCSSGREQLVLASAETLSDEEFQAVTRSDDERVLLGGARLFFFEDYSSKIPEGERAAIAAKLCEIVVRGDRCGNADMGIPWLRHYPCPETERLMKRLAMGEINVAQQTDARKDEPIPRAAACVVLAYLSSPALADGLAIVKKIPDLDEFDQAALLVARALGGERGLLGASIFKLNSYTIGFGALTALEREGGADAINAVIMGGTTHSWAAVRKKAVASAARMCGQDWNPDEWDDAKAAREWWGQHKGEFEAQNHRVDGPNVK